METLMNRLKLERFVLLVNKSFFYHDFPLLQILNI